MYFEQIAVGGDKNFSYIIADEITKEAVIFDPAFNIEKLDIIIRKKEFILKYLIYTHSHKDHINGNDYFKNKYPEIESIMHVNTDYPVDIKIEDEMEWEIGTINLKFIYTPGHSKDSICILINDKKLISGDTLFVGKIGGTGENFPTSDAEQEWDSLHKLIELLDENIEVWPGHDYGKKKSSTIKYEKENNPFLLCENFEKFVWLKEHWIEYKKEHKIK